MCAENFFFSFHFIAPQEIIFSSQLYCQKKKKSWGKIILMLQVRTYKGLAYSLFILTFGGIH